ncbi:glycosyltransferase [Ornithinicoccus halotolerans]|uniref:glycosyltransferase n=1 Tax=Ornithinicoccus halotolerans TaxID=1748220 RepID=UPI0012959C18|nr:glycosyltransferase [Ornithinicoccus halotolerans]
MAEAAAQAPSPVEVVIAVHTPERPIGQAVASVLDGNGDVASVTVVCHNTSTDRIAPGVAGRHRDRVRWLEHHDDRRSPAGPFNAGMRAARGRYVSIMGSDDTLAEGAVASWLALARRTGAETVVSRLVIGSGHRIVRTPPTRPWRRGVLDPVRDRLSYRSAPLGLVSTAARARLGAELVEGLAVGDDVPYVTRLWCETAVAYDRGGPPYQIGVDAADRVTYATRPVGTELAFVDHLLTQAWFTGYPPAVRRAVVTKLARIHVFGLVWHRDRPALWDEPERRQLAAVTAALEAAAPGYAGPLSRADRALLDACADPGVPAAELVARARARRRHGTPATLLPRDLRHLTDREAPPRFMAASLLVR